MEQLNEIFGRETENGIALFHECGEAITQLDVQGIYPVGSDFSTRYEHPEGIVISVEDATALGIEIEC